MKLLCTDLDRTLLPNGEQVESPLARPLLWQLILAKKIALAYVSGRDFARVLRAIEEYDLPHPDVIVADVGTSIYVPLADAQWQLHEPWQRLIGADWNGLDSKAIARILDEIDLSAGLQAQEEDRQSRYKRSYYLAVDTDTDSLAKRLYEYFHANGIHASLVFSDDPEAGVKLLDILPASATKLDAVLHIQELLDVPQDQCLFSGDSGNDVTALASHLPSVTVANADEATRRAVRDLAAERGTQSSSYQAKGGLPVADSKPLNGNYAAGIVEGLLHFRPQWQAQLRDSDWVAEALAAFGPSRLPPGEAANRLP